MMTGIIVREAVPSDAEVIADIHVRSWQRAYRGIMPDDFLDSLSVEKRRAQRIRILERQAPPYRNFIAEVDGEIVGFCDVGPSQEVSTESESATGELLAIYVAPGQERTGVGTALMEKSLELLRADGFQRAALWVLAANMPARHFYEKADWVTDGTLRIEECGTFTVEEVRYVKQLEQNVSQE